MLRRVRNLSLKYLLINCFLKRKDYEKDEITRVRLLSLAILIALSLFILLVPIGSNEFGQIISKMNNNALNIPESQNSVYNLYYYTGFNVVYQLFFSLTVLFTAVSLTGIF